MQEAKARILTPNSSTSTTTTLNNSNSSSSLSFQASASNSNLRKKRVGKACDSCRLKKTKCNGKQPCERCTLDNKICVYTERKKSKDKVYTTEHVELMEKRLEMVSKSLLKLCEMVKIGKREDLKHFSNSLDLIKNDEDSAKVSINQAISLLVDMDDHSDMEDLESEEQEQEQQEEQREEQEQQPEQPDETHVDPSNHIISSPVSISPKSSSHDLSPTLLLDASTSDNLSNHIPLDSINEEENLSLVNVNSNQFPNDQPFSYDYTQPANAGSFVNFANYSVYDANPTLVSPTDDFDEIAMMGFNSLNLPNFRSNSIGLFNNNNNNNNTGHLNSNSQLQLAERFDKHSVPIPRSLNEISIHTPDLQSRSNTHNNGYFSPSSITSDSSTMLLKSNSDLLTNSNVNSNGNTLFSTGDNSFADQFSTSPPVSLLKRNSSVTSFTGSNTGSNGIKKVPHSHQHSHQHQHSLPSTHFSHSANQTLLEGLNIAELPNINLTPLMIPGQASANPDAFSLQKHAQ